MKYGPPRQPSWRLWLSNDSGEGHTWTHPDGPEFAPGWHLFVLRWDHGIPRLELSIDARPLIVAHGYEKYWPNEYPDRALIGCWPNFWAEHYLNTYVWRTQLFTRYVNDEWIHTELAERQPVLFG